MEERKAELEKERRERGGNKDRARERESKRRGGKKGRAREREKGKRRK